MSNPLKAVGKVFKAVVKVVKAVLPIIIAAAAIYFSAGLAAGALPALGAAAPAVGTAAAGASVAAPVTTAAFGGATGLGMGVAPAVAPSAFTTFANAVTAGNLKGAIVAGAKGVASGVGKVAAYAGQNQVLAAAGVQAVGQGISGYQKAKSDEAALKFEKDLASYDGGGGDTSYDARPQPGAQGATAPTAQGKGLIGRDRTPEQYDPARTEGGIIPEQTRSAQQSQPVASSVLEQPPARDANGNPIEPQLLTQRAPSGSRFTFGASA